MRSSLFVCVILLAITVVFSQLIALPRAQHSETHEGASGSPISAQQIWSGLMEGNARFVAGKPKPRDLSGLRDGLAEDQHPKAIVLACSDSRVAPELLFDQSLGDLFVIRSAGNIADAIGIGSMEYAVEHLGSKVLIVLGHTKCGAVTAACSKEKMPSPGLQSIVDKIQPAVANASKSVKSDDLVETSIRENIHQSAKDVLANSEILRHAAEHGNLTIFEAEYQLNTGKVVRLENARP